jgi:hypothetical protein
MAPTDGLGCDLLAVSRGLMECGSLHPRIPSPYEASKMLALYVKPSPKSCKDIDAKLQF